MPTKTDLQVTRVPVEVLNLDPGNPRHHSEKQIRQIAQSIKSFGFNVPVLIDGAGKVLAGHGRVLAARKLGLAEVPTIRLEHLTPEQSRAFAIADNRLTENSEWNDSLLAASLKELTLADLDFGLEATGFTLDEIDLRIEGLTEAAAADPADMIPDVPEGPTVSRSGDLWQLGPHRVLCGDATKPEDLQRLMNGVRAAMAFTDPPYGVDYIGKGEVRGKRRRIMNDNLGDSFGEFLAAACARILSNTDGAVYICMSSNALHTLHRAFEGAGGYFSTYIIWAKQAFTLGRSDYHRQYEPILYGWRKEGGHFWCGARNQGDVWFFNRPSRNDLHPTQKPVELVMRALRNSSERGAVVLDTFLGSGTTLIAAERTGRVCYGLELDAAYVDTVIRRWQQHTGDHAVHAGTGRLFDDIATRTGEIA